MANLLTIITPIALTATTNFSLSLSTIDDVYVVSVFTENLEMTVVDFFKARGLNARNIRSINIDDRQYQYYQVDDARHSPNNTFTRDGNRILLKTTDTLAGGQVNINYAYNYLSVNETETLELPPRKLLARDFTAKKVIPSYNESDDTWQYNLSDSGWWFANIIPNFQIDAEPSEIFEVRRNEEDFLEKTGTGALGEKSYMFENDTFPLLTIKDEDYKQYYTPFEISTNQELQTENIEIAEPRLFEKNDRLIRLGSKFYGKIILHKESAEVLNIDGALNDIAQSEILGKKAFLYNIKNNELENVYRGIIDEVSVTTESMRVSIGPTQSLIDTNFLESVNDVYSVESDELIPILFGRNEGVKLLYTEFNDNNNCVFIAGVEDDNYLYFNVSFPNGDRIPESELVRSGNKIIYIGNDQARAREGLLATVSSDRINPENATSLSPIHIIQNLLNSFTNLKYKTENFDISEISLQDIKNISFVANKETVLENFNEILKKCFLFFIYKHNGLFTIRKIDYDPEPITINAKDIVGVPSYQKSREDQATSVRYLYRKIWNSENEHGRSYHDTRDEDDGLRNLGLKKVEEFETLYYNLQDIQDISQAITRKITGNRIVLDIELKSLPENINLLDKVSLEVKINRHEFLPNIDYTVIAISRSGRTLSLEGFI